MLLRSQSLRRMINSTDINGSLLKTLSEVLQREQIMHQTLTRTQEESTKNLLAYRELLSEYKKLLLDYSELLEKFNSFG